MSKRNHCLLRFEVSAKSNTDKPFYTAKLRTAYEQSVQRFSISTKFILNKQNVRKILIVLRFKSNPKRLNISLPKIPEDLSSIQNRFQFYIDIQIIQF